MEDLAVGEIADSNVPILDGGLSLRDALEEFLRARSDIAIVRDGGRLGITTHEAMLRIILERAAEPSYLDKIKLREALIDCPIVSPRTTLRELSALLRKLNSCYAIVAEEENILGIVRARDILTAVLRRMLTEEAV